jgi:hypothetical protein
MPRQNPTYDSAHPFNPWRLLGPAWDPSWTEKEPPPAAKTWMRSPEGRQATDDFYAAYAAAEEVYQAAMRREVPDTSRWMRKKARRGFSKVVAAAGAAWRQNRLERLNRIGKYSRVKPIES